GREAEYADLIAQHYRQYYAQANLARSRNTARRQAVRDKVIRYLVLAGEQAVSHHAAAKAERNYTDALALLEEDALADDVPRRVELFAKRGDTHWTQLHGDEAWDDYQEALRLWSAYSAIMMDRGPISDQVGQTQVAAPSVPAGTAYAMVEPLIPSAAPRALPLDWHTQGMKLYRLLVQLPSRHPSLFQRLPEHEELLTYLQEGLRLADELRQRDTLEGAALLTAKAFFWWSWP